MNSVRQARPLLQGWKRALRLQYLRILRQRASPRSLARGLALGVFVGFLPIIPFQIVVIIGLAIPLRANQVAAVASSFICNAFNMIPFYYLLYMVGRLALPFDAISFDPQHLALKDLVAQGWRLVAAMFAGSLILGAPSAAATYLASLKAITAYRARRSLRSASRQPERVAP